MITKKILENARGHIESVTGGSVRSVEDIGVLGRVRRIIFPSTDFFYEGSPRLVQFIPVENQTAATREHVGQLAASLARASKTALLLPLIEAADDEQIREVDVDTQGPEMISGRIDRGVYMLGTEDELLAESIEIGVSLMALVRQFAQSGHYAVFLAHKQSRRVLAIAACEYKVSERAANVIEALHDLKVEIVVLSSLKSSLTKYLSQRLKLPVIHSDLSDGEKEKIAEDLYKTEPNTLLVVSRAHWFNAAEKVCVADGLLEGCVAAVPHIESLPDLVRESARTIKKTKKIVFWAKL